MAAAAVGDLGSIESHVSGTAIETPAALIGVATNPGGAVPLLTGTAAEAVPPPKAMTPTMNSAATSAPRALMSTPPAPGARTCYAPGALSTGPRDLGAHAGRRAPGRGDRARGGRWAGS